MRNSTITAIVGGAFGIVTAVAAQTAIAQPGAPLPFGSTRAGAGGPHRLQPRPGRLASRHSDVEQRDRRLRRVPRQNRRRRHHRRRADAVEGDNQLSACAGRPCGDRTGQSRPRVAAGASAGFLGDQRPDVMRRAETHPSKEAHCFRGERGIAFLRAVVWTQFYSKSAYREAWCPIRRSPDQRLAGAFYRRRHRSRESLEPRSAARRRPNFVLATKPPLPHNAIMVETHPFTFRIEADPLRELRYRWTVCEGSQVHVRSPHSYATRREAENEAAKAVARREDHWRNGG